MNKRSVGTRRRAVGMVAIAVVALVVASCIKDATYTGKPGGQKVAVLGDITAENAYDALHAALDPSFQVRIVTGSIGSYNATTSDAYQHAEELAAEDPDVLVVALGTGDIQASDTAADVLDGIDAITALFPEACLVFVTVTEQGVTGGAVPYDNAVAADVNIGLFDRVGDQAFVADWDWLSRDDEGVYRNPADGITPTEDGGLLVADLVRGQVVSGCFDGGS